MLGLSAINLITTVVFCRDTGIKRGQYPVQKHICHADTHQLSLLKITLINQLKGPVNSAGKARWAGISKWAHKTSNNFFFAHILPPILDKKYKL